MKTTMLVRSVALVLLGVVAASRPQLAEADALPPDISPSCIPFLQDGYFTNPPAGTLQQLASLPARYGATDQLEGVSFWRVNCGGGQAALQMRLGFWDPLNDPRVYMPRLTVNQGGIEVGIDALGVMYPNSPQAPVLIPVGSADASPGMFVLSNRGEAVDLKGALTVQVRNPVSGEVRLSVDIPAFVPAPTLRPIDGRLVGNYYDPSKSGEGILVEIGDAGPAQPGQRQRHFLQYSWFTYDNDGRPFWISGGAEFLEGDTHVRMPAIYRGGGRFAGRKGATDTKAWGTVDMEFADCNTLRISYNGNEGLPANVPSGSGHLEWKRLTSVSGYRCD